VLLKVWHTFESSFQDHHSHVALTIMTIKIISSFKEFSLSFVNEEDFKKIHEQILEALTDDSNTKGVFYEQENSSKFFPALFLKSSVIEIEKGDSKLAPFTF